MIEIKLNTSNPDPIVNWCGNAIGPLKYWLHNKIGGNGWDIVKIERSWNLRIQNEKQGLIALLKFSDKVERMN